jgi:hypothetical protein
MAGEVGEQDLQSVGVFEGQTLSRRAADAAGVDEDEQPVGVLLEACDGGEQVRGGCWVCSWIGCLLLALVDHVDLAAQAAQSASVMSWSSRSSPLVAGSVALRVHGVTAGQPVTICVCSGDGGTLPQAASSNRQLSSSPFA